MAQKPVQKAAQKPEQKAARIIPSSRSESNWPTAIISGIGGAVISAVVSVSIMNWQISELRDQAAKDREAAAIRVEAAKTEVFEKTETEFRTKVSDIRSKIDAYQDSFYQKEWPIQIKKIIEALPKWRQHDDPPPEIENMIKNIMAENIDRANKFYEEINPILSNLVTSKMDERDEFTDLKTMIRNTFLQTASLMRKTNQDAEERIALVDSAETLSELKRVWIPLLSGFDQVLLPRVNDLLHCAILALQSLEEHTLDGWDGCKKQIEAYEEIEARFAEQ